MMRHRDAWASRSRRRPRSNTWPSSPKKRKGEDEDGSEEADKARRIVGLSDDGLPKEVLIVVSKLKAYVKARSGMSTSDGAMDVLSSHLRKLCDKAVRARRHRWSQNGHGSRLRGHPQGARVPKPAHRAHVASQRSACS